MLEIEIKDKMMIGKWDKKVLFIGMG